MTSSSSTVSFADEMQHRDRPHDHGIRAGAQQGEHVMNLHINDRNFAAAALGDEQPPLLILPLAKSVDLWSLDSSSSATTSTATSTTITTTMSTTLHLAAPYSHSLSMSPCSSDDSDLLVLMGPDQQPTPTKKLKKSRRVRALSTERSRQCRERQKQYSQSLDAVVRALRTDVRDLEILRNLRQEQIVNVCGSVSGSLAKIIREYMTVFRHGMPAPAVETALARGKRDLAVMYQPTPDAQCEFLNCMMDPYVEVFDWCGRFVLGASTVLNGWRAWAAWHDSLSFELVNIDVVDTEDTLAVTTKANLRVRVSPTTIAHLFPHIADDRELCRKLLGQEICYPVHDTFFFAANKRVIKYTCDVDFSKALLPVAGNYETVLYLMSPPSQASLSDLAVRTSPGDLAERSPLDVKFLLSEE
uniref:BZIP domain-containing protein n=1 Tax=Peronospora matthiolae TaxID=2874970 RepID=A0AAV1TIA9_9STRA